MQERTNGNTAQQVETNFDEEALNMSFRLSPKQEALVTIARAIEERKSISFDDNPLFTGVIVKECEPLHIALLSHDPEEPLFYASFENKEGSYTICVPLSSLESKNLELYMEVLEDNCGFPDSLDSEPTPGNGYEPSYSTTDFNTARRFAHGLAEKMQREFGSILGDPESVALHSMGYVLPAFGSLHQKNIVQNLQSIRAYRISEFRSALKAYNNRNSLDVLFSDLFTDGRKQLQAMEAHISWYDKRIATLREEEASGLVTNVHVLRPGKLNERFCGESDREPYFAPSFIERINQSRKASMSDA